MLRRSTLSSLQQKQSLAGLTLAALFLLVLFYKRVPKEEEQQTDDDSNGPNKNSADDNKKDHNLPSEDEYSNRSTVRIVKKKFLNNLNPWPKEEYFEITIKSEQFLKDGIKLEKDNVTQFNEVEISDTSNSLHLQGTVAYRNGGENKEDKLVIPFCLKNWKEKEVISLENFDPDYCRNVTCVQLMDVQTYPPNSNNLNELPNPYKRLYCHVCVKQKYQVVKNSVF